MTIKTFHLHVLEYERKLKPVLIEESEQSYFPSRHNITVEVYRIKRTKATLVYNGMDLIKVTADNARTIDRTRSRLEKLSKTQWGEVKHGRN